MPNISDRRLSTLYSNWQRTSQPIGKDQALEILAQVGDNSKWSASKLLTELKKPGMTTAQQIALSSAGMSASEKKDIATILDQPGLPLEPAAKAFLEQVIGRTTPTPPPPNPPPATTGLSVTGNQANGLSGLTKAGATIEAINITTAPGGRLHMEDTMVVGKADANGKFSMAKLTGDQVMKEGDLVRMRARYADGTTSDWVTVKAAGIEAKDGRNAVVALFRIGMADAGGGKVSVDNINASRQVSEPGAKLQFTNNRTGEKTQVVITDTGGFPAGTKLHGKAGDSFSIAASDGVNNTAFTTSVGNVTVPGGAAGTTDLIPDPALHANELDSAGKPKFSKVNFTGPLFIDGPTADDVQQGQIGDCYFPAAMAAIARHNPDALSSMIKDNGDGTYTVTFKEKDWATGRFKDVQVKVDGDLYARSYGGALYGRSANSSDPKKMELWFPLVEKAYAQWKGSYDAIGNGGSSADVFEEFTGAMGRSTNAAGNPDSVWRTITTAIDAKKPVAAGTHDDGGPVNYANTGVFGDHAYSILGYEKVGTDRILIIRNPWGESEPAGNGANDGVFKMKLEEFQKLYDNVMTTN